jgi:arsenate reductase
MKRVLVLGKDNACRSPMMAALMKHISFNRIDVYSAGINPRKIDSLVLKVMQEIGIDISKEKSRAMNEFIHTKFDIIITTDPEAREISNKLLLGSTKIHKEFDDPRKIKGSSSDRENAYREMRDSMSEWLNEFITRHRLIA